MPGDQNGMHVVSISVLYHLGICVSAPEDMDITGGHLCFFRARERRTGKRAREHAKKECEISESAECERKKTVNLRFPLPSSHHVGNPALEPEITR